LRRPSARGLLVLAVLAAAAAAWVAIALVLWRTRVPSDLTLPSLDEHDYFTNAELEAAHEYERVVRLLLVGSLLTTLLVLVLYAWRGARFLRESAAGPIGSGMLLAMLGFALVWLSVLPFGLLEVWWQRRHGLTEAGYADVVVGGWLALGGEFVGLSLAILIVMGFARLLPRFWWIPGAAVFVGLAALGTFVYPYLSATETHPLRDPALLAAADRLEQEDGLPDIRIDVATVSTETTAPNAEAVGLGPSRRIVLWDTILDGRFDDDQLVVVIAHELGHHASEHLPKGIAWYALFAFPGAWLIARSTRRRGGMREPAAVPLALLVFVGLQLLALPALNAVGRHMEAEADWVALETTEDPDAARGLFEGFSDSLLADPDPPAWTKALVETHPTILERIAMVEAWEERRGGP
jgi:STE24 endopeptidase